MAINVEELMSPSEDENEEEEDEWRPEKPEKGRRTSKKPKGTGVRLQLELRASSNFNSTHFPNSVCICVIHEGKLKPLNELMLNKP